MNATPGFRREDLVEVKSLDEILGTLDADGKLDGLPFMPEMAKYCGQRFRVYRRATKTCVEGPGVRRMDRTVLLDGLRCDGAAHEGCQRACLLFWKEAWLNPCADAAPTDAVGDGGEPRQIEDGSDARLATLPTKKGDRFFCQSTELLGATHEMSGGNLYHFLRDFLVGDLTLAELSRSLWHKAVNRLRRRFGRGLYKHIAGCNPTPVKGDLNLQPGEWVEVKSAEEITLVLDAEGRNRGLPFELEMLDYCGRRFQVAFAIEQVIGEESGKKNWGKMFKLGNTVALEGVTCRGLCMKNCPRGNYLWWRESWLRRVAVPADAADHHERTLRILDIATPCDQGASLTGAS